MRTRRPPNPLVVSWMATPGQRRLSPGSQRRNKATVAHFARWLGERPLIAATTADVDDWLATREPMTADSRSTYLGSVHAFFEWARATGQRSDSPTAPLRCPRRTLADSLAVDVSAVSDDAASLTMGDLAKIYLGERVRRGEIAELSARNHRGYLESFARSFGDEAVAEITREHIELWMETRGTLAPATRRGQLSTVKGFTAWLARRGFIPSDPAGDIPKVRMPRQLPRGLAGDQVTRLLRACPDERGMLIVLLMLQEGLRCGEVSGIEMGDLALQERMMRVVGKGGHERLLPISDETWDALTRYLDAYPPSSGPLVRSYRQPWRPLAPDTISGMVSGWLAEAGVKRFARDRISGHSCRHTAATDMLRGGAHLRDVQAALGHASLATTQVYLPLVVNDLRTAMGGRRYRSPKPASEVTT